MRRLIVPITITALALAVPTVSSAAPSATGQAQMSAQAQRVFEFWTPERMRAAVDRDIVVDERGRSFIRTSGGLVAYGTGELISLGAGSSAKPGPSADISGPSISGQTPDGVTLTSSVSTFSATVTDPSGVKSVSMTLAKAGVAAQSFSLKQGTNNVWSVSLSGLTSGDWTWQITALDKVSPSNRTLSNVFAFAVLLSSGGSSSGGDIANAQYTTTSTVLNASGRIFFEMPANKSLSRWSSYVCSGTVVSDGSTTDSKSLILTAAHCVYDDANKSFARNVMFIPNQQASGTPSDRTCSNDIYGCWAPSAAVVDTDWSTRSWPNNIPWDYGYYVVPNSGAYTPGVTTVNAALESAISPMSITFNSPSSPRTSAFGYSYNQDPKLMYCAQARGFTGGSTALSSDNWWLDQCGLTGGASGGPWLDENAVAGTGSIISVNSWGYTGSPGMAGAKFSDSSMASRVRKPCAVYTTAKGLSNASPNTLAVATTCS